MTQYVRMLSLVLNSRRLLVHCGWRNLSLAGSLVLSGLMASFAHAEEAKRCGEFAARLDSLEGKVQWQVSGDSQWQTASLNQTFCYGDIILVQEKRAALRLSNNTLVRLNERSSIKLIPPTQSFWLELIDGAAHFLTRTPKSFTVKAPFVNAAVEGTEFLVTAQNGVNQVGVIEGQVRSGNTAGSVLLTQGMSTQTSSAEQAPGAPVQLKLNDFVSWAMYFPPLPNRLNVPADIKALLEQGQDGEVIGRISRDGQASAEILSLGAALALNRGQLPLAEELVQRAFKLNPKHPDAQAIAALLDLGRGEAERGQQRAAQNVLDNPFNPTALIAHSYSQQGQGRLQGALDSALEARRLAPGDSQIIARVAELHLALGQKAPARKALDEALALAPNHSRLLTFKGFSLLAERKGKAAQTYFAKASQQDSADPYAQLGWGLALIQQGKLEPGREHLELAVILDPANSLLRSYLGKGYFEENRLKVAETQLSLAQTLDPNDPTPWYYLSQVKHDQHRYGEALKLVETAIEKNNNRAVYRQDAAMDSDAAARLADKSRVYQAMGADQLAISAASAAIRAAPNDYAGHRAMAMALTGKEGNQTARANEALQASLLAPIGATPLAPGFAETAMQVLPGAGPHEMGINEYNAAFSPNGINGFASVLGAGNNTRATEGQVQLVGEKTDFSVGQYHYSSDGFRENNDRDYLVNEARLKYQVIDNLKIELKALEREDDLGDLSDQIISSEYSKESRQIKRKENYSFGLNYGVGESINLSVYRSNKHISNTYLSNDYFPWGDSVKSELLYGASPTITAALGEIDSGIGDIYLGYKQIKLDEEFGAIFVDTIEGVEQLPIIDDVVREKNNIDQYSVDYAYRGPNFYLGLGAEKASVEKIDLVPMDDVFISGALGFNCTMGFECKYVHKEFLTLPAESGESLRYQLVNAYAGRNDYQTFTRVEIDGVGFERDWSRVKAHGNFQRSRVASPSFSNGLDVKPNLKEKEYTFGVNALSIAGADVALFEYSYNQSTAHYKDDGLFRGNIPNLFRTEHYKMSFEQEFWAAVTGTASISAVEQRYDIKRFVEEEDLKSKVSFVNLNLSIKYAPCKMCIIEALAFNVLDNNKNYIEGYLASLVATDQAASLDRFFTERVFALSVKLRF